MGDNALYHPRNDLHERVSASRDLAGLLIGERLGGGITRDVYTLKLNPDLVIKFEKDGLHFQNALEWRVWNSVKIYPKFAKWFAPCLAISDNALWLIQKRVTPMLKRDLPTRLPDFMNDTQFCNFGMLNGKVVACDYGVQSFAFYYGKTSKLVNADWCGESPDG